MQHAIILARLTVGQRNDLSRAYAASIEIQRPVAGQVAAIQITRSHFTGGAIAHPIQGALEFGGAQCRGSLQHLVALTAIVAGLHQLVEATRTIEQPETGLGIEARAVTEIAVLIVIASEAPVVEVTAYVMAIFATGGGSRHQVLTVVQLLDAGRDAYRVGAGGILKLNRSTVIDDGKGGAQLAVHLVTNPICRCITQGSHQAVGLSADDITDFAALIDAIKEIAAPLVGKARIVVPERVTDGA
ncbi:hypothetical protein D3C80_1340880 [compost metagenome]